MFHLEKDLLIDFPLPNVKDEFTKDTAPPTSPCSGYVKLKDEMTRSSSVGSRHNHGVWSVQVARAPPPSSAHSPPPAPARRTLALLPPRPRSSCSSPCLQQTVPVSRPSHMLFSLPTRSSDIRAPQEFRQGAIFSSRKILFNLFS